VVTSPRSHISVLQDGKVLEELIEEEEPEEAAVWRHVTASECSNAAFSKWSESAHKSHHAINTGVTGMTGVRQLVSSGSKALTGRRNQNQGSGATVQQGDASTVVNASSVSVLNDPNWFGLVNLLRCGWAFCPSHFAPTVKWGPPRNAKLNKC